MQKVFTIYCHKLSFSGKIEVGYHLRKSVNECPNTSTIGLHSVQMEATFETQNLCSSTASSSERNWKRISAIKKWLFPKHKGPDSKQHAMLRDSKSYSPISSGQCSTRDETDLIREGENNDALKSMENSKKDKKAKKEKKTLLAKLQKFKKNSEEKSTLKSNDAKKENERHIKEQSRHQSKKESKGQSKEQGKRRKSKSRKCSLLKEETLEENNGENEGCFQFSRKENNEAAKAMRIASLFAAKEHNAAVLRSKECNSNRLTAKECGSKDEPLYETIISQVIELNQNKTNHDTGEMKVRKIVSFKNVSVHDAGLISSPNAAWMDVLPSAPETSND